MKSLRSFSLAFFLSLGLQAFSSAELLIKKGDKVAFLGDSITAAGARGNGYVNLVKKALAEKGTTITVIPAGKPGNKSNDMLGRLEASVLSRNPNWMVLSCGVNDVWHFDLKMGNRTFNGVSLEDYKKNISSIVDQADKKKVKVLLMTSSMISENPDYKLNKNLEPYNEFIRELAKKRKYPLAEINGAMQKKIKDLPDVKGKGTLMATKSYQYDIKNKLTSDGVHMNKHGNIMMAKEVLKAMGMKHADIEKASASW